MLNLESFESDTTWLTLPIGRRAASLRRLEGLRWYLEDSDRSLASLGNAAEKAGVSQRTFYNLLREWEATEAPSIWLLVPYGRRRPTGRPKLEEPVERQLRTLIAASVGSGRRLRDEVVADVVTRWPRDAIRQPALNTIRSHVARFAPGSLYLPGRDPDGLHPREIETTRHGQVLAVDHVGLHIYGDNETAPAPLTLTLVIDWHTATIAGFQTWAGPPSPDLVQAALMHARYLSKDNSGPEVVPKLVFYAPSNDDWRAFVERLEQQGLDSTVRWGARLHTGMLAKRLIGSHIGRVGISPRVVKHKANFDPNHHAAVTPHQAELIVGSAVREMNAERLPPLTVTSRIGVPDLMRG
jgi:hypothetical protein